MKEYIGIKEISLFSRMSEYEIKPSFIDQSDGVWLDSFDGNWFDKNLIEDLLLKDKRICIVSSELHGRDHSELWEFLLSTGLYTNSNLILCTDLPMFAKEYFHAN